MSILLNASARPVARAFALTLGVAMLAACGGTPAQNNGAAAAPVITGTQVQVALAEFDRVCSRPMDRAAYVAAAPGAGWEGFEPPAESPLGRLLAMGQAAVEAAGNQMNQSGAARIENSAFRKTANGHELILLVSETAMPGMAPSLECRVYDFAAPAPTPAEITAWTTTQANNRVNEQGLTSYGWQPGFRQGFSRIDVTHIDPASPLRAQLPITGLGITAFQGPTTAE